MKKYIIEDTLNDFEKNILQCSGGFKNENDVNEWLENNIMELNYIYDFLINNKDFDGDIYILGDMINLLSNIKFIIAK